MYDITLEFGKDFNNAEFRIESICTNENEIAYIQKVLPQEEPALFNVRFDWPTGPQKINNPRRQILQSFFNMNFRYNLPDDWHDNHILRCYSYLSCKDKDNNKKLFFYWPEVEQTEYAIKKIICKYPIYKNYTPQLVYSNGQFSFKLFNEDSKLFWTTDIMTSLWQPYLALLKSKISKDEYFSYNFSTEKFARQEHFRSKLEAYPQFAAFTKVLYTIGNMCPVDKNKGTGHDKSLDKNSTWSSDAWDYKLSLIKNHFDGKGGGELGKTIASFYSEQNKCFDTFICDHFLNDYVTSEGKLIRIYNLSDFSEWASLHRPTKEQLLSFFANCTKLIIQRGYRIESGFIGKWTEEHAIEVRKAFKAVGLPEDENLNPDRNGLSYSIIGEWEDE